MENKSPLRYPGGKTRACKILDSILNKYFDINNYKKIISPFFGGGSFEFYVQNKYGIHIIANDKFTPLYNFWNTCKNDKNKLCDTLITKLNTINSEKFTNMKNQIMNENNTFEQSIMYFIINRCSFNGSTLSGGFSLEASNKRFTKSSVDKINELNLSQFEIYNLDFEEFLHNTTNNDTEYLLFLDPPYYLNNNSKLYGKNGDLHENFNHNKLFTYLSTKKNWLLTYNNCDYIRNLYKDYTIIDTNWSYSMNKSKISSEIVIISK